MGLKSNSLLVATLGDPVRMEQRVAVSASEIDRHMRHRLNPWAFVHPVSTVLYQMGLGAPGRWSCRYNPADDYYYFTKETPL